MDDESDDGIDASDDYVIASPTTPPYEMPLVGKVFLALVVTEAVVLIAFCFSTFFVDSPNHVSVSLYGLLGIFCTACFIYFATDGVINENPFQLWAFVLVASLLINSYILLHVITPGTFAGTTAFTDWSLPLLVFTLAFQLAYFGLAVPVHQSFGWRRYRIAGPDIVLGDNYQTYQIFRTLFKVDLMMVTVLFAMTGFFLYGMYLWEKIFNLVGFLLTLLWAMCGYVAMRIEHTLMARIYLANAVWGPMYCVFKAVQFVICGQDCYERTDIPQFYITGGLFLCFRALLVVWTFKTMNNFGRGLKERVFHPQQLLGFMQAFLSKDDKDQDISNSHDPNIQHANSV